MPLLTETDAAWLGAEHPALTLSEDGTELSGTLAFDAAYDRAADVFTVRRSGAPEPAGVRLRGAYKIRVKDEIETAERRFLPRLFMEEVAFPFTTDRHFMTDNSACLCGPSDEMAFVASGYTFQKYLERLCIPFLYGQAFYDREGRWPWRDYNHGTLGALESYFAHGNPENLPYTVIGYLEGKPSWPILLATLQSKSRPKGHMACLCGSGAPIRTCHAEAWEGLKKLYADFRSLVAVQETHGPHMIK